MKPLLIIHYPYGTHTYTIVDINRQLKENGIAASHNVIWFYDKVDKVEFELVTAGPKVAEPLVFRMPPMNDSSHPVDKEIVMSVKKHETVY